jgi:hypothetical protein
MRFGWKELLDMDVDGDTRELIQKKHNFLNISSEASVYNQNVIKYGT